jgi:hypothetical protein
MLHRKTYNGKPIKPFESIQEIITYINKCSISEIAFLLDLNPSLPDDQGWEVIQDVNGANWFTQQKDEDIPKIVAERRLYARPPDVVVYTVWNEAHTEGFVTTDKGLAYETRKCADTNLYDVNGVFSPVAAAFCEQWGEGNCTMEEREG